MSNAQPGGNPAGANLRGAVDLSSLVRPPAGAHAAPNGVVFEANDASFTSVLDLSARVPVIVEFYGQGIEPALGAVIESYGGRLALATIDGTANPSGAGLPGAAGSDRRGRGRRATGAVVRRRDRRG